MSNQPKRPRILIVDDNPTNIEILMQILKSDYAVIAATNGEKALQLINQANSRPDMVLLDIMMPGMDGYEVCRRLQADPTNKGLPVIFISALEGEDDEAKGLDIGGVDYITKPISPRLVKARIRNHLELKAHRDHLEHLITERTRELLTTQDVTICTLAAIAETKDPETGGHIQRTKNYVRILAQHLQHHEHFHTQLSDEAINLIYKSAPLHDVGKVGIPDSILTKPGKLTTDEFEEMKKHPIYGRDALTLAEKHLGETSFLRFAIDVAYTHHEKWDGSGYPQGLKGDAIPLAGRLMALADVYDALISKRVYKSPFTHTKAVEIIIKGRGSHFDPDMVDAFVALEEEFRQIALEYADFEEEREALSKTWRNNTPPCTEHFENP